MFFKKKNKKVEVKNEQTGDRLPFDKRETVSPLSLVVTIVNRNQGYFFVNQFQELGVSLSMVLFGYSMPPIEVQHLLAINETRKDIVLSLARTSDVNKMKEIADKRFSVSKQAKGVLFTSPLNGVSGISVYKYLSDQNREMRGNNMNEENKEVEVKEETVGTVDKNEFSLVLAIVNKGNTDLVMEAARKAGARGGTITVARGTGNQELAKEYGIVIQPEKEMVFIVVSNDIKDAVMKAIYDEAGISTKGMGIVVSLPISDTVGLGGSTTTQVKSE